MNASVKKLQWLIKRELWENKGMVVWSQVAVAGTMLAFVLLALLLRFNLRYQENGRNFDLQRFLTSKQFLERIPDTVSGLYLIIGTPLYLMLGAIIFFYCLNALHDDRRDRSLLFWKSLPVSDQMTVLSKLAMALLVTPLVTLAASLGLAMAMFLTLGLTLLSYGANLFGPLFSTPELYLQPLRIAAIIPVYVLWALPTVGWLLLVSSWARSKVIVWAVGVPAIAAAVLGVVDKFFVAGEYAGWIVDNVLARLLGGLVPGAWHWLSDDVTLHSRNGVTRMIDVFGAGWQSLATPEAWLGAAAGAAMIAGAVWMRRWREEG